MPSKHQEPRWKPQYKTRRTFIVTGEHAAPFTMGITNKNSTEYVGGATPEVGTIEASSHYDTFMFQNIIRASGVDVTIEVNMGGGWITAPEHMLESDAATKSVLPSAGPTITTLRLPFSGPAVRLSVPATAAGADMTFIVSMYMRENYAYRA